MTAQRRQSWWAVAVVLAVLLGSATAYLRHQRAAPAPAADTPARPSLPATQPARGAPLPAPPDRTTGLPPAREQHVTSARPRSDPPTAGRAPTASADAAGDTPAVGVPEFFARALAGGAPPPEEQLQDASPQQLQALMDREPRDEAWASRVEWQLENYLALQSHQAALGTPTVSCRTTVCRVISTTSKRTMSNNPEADWHELIAGLQYESVANEFAQSREMIVFNHSRPEQVGYVTYFTRVRSAAEHRGDDASSAP